MKKLLILLSVIGMTVSVFADKGGTGESENEPEEPANRNGEPANETENPNTPPPPPPNVKDEVENNTSPSDLLKKIEELEDDKDALVKDLDNHKAFRETLIKQRQELRDEVEKLQDDKSDLLEDLDTASKEIKSLVEEQKALRTGLHELEDVIDKGPGSLFKGWVYSQELKWVYVSPSIVPYAFSQNDGWMLYEYGTHPRRVYYYTTKKWELLDEVQKKQNRTTEK